MGESMYNGPFVAMGERKREGASSPRHGAVEGG